VHYPLNLSFKIIAVAPQLSLTDNNGQLLFYVKQKLFKLKEAITVFADQAQTEPMFQINADRVIDWSARYTFTDRSGMQLGAVKRQGMKSLWRARYDVLDQEHPVFTITEENPFAKVLDSLLGEVPVVGLISGYLFHPSYQVARSDGTAVMRLRKQPAFLEGRFTIEQLAPLNEREEQQALLSLLMLVLLERGRG
jgi:uncharacterized protein YxjI